MVRWFDSCARWISDLRALSEMDSKNKIACERKKYLEVNDAQTLLEFLRNKQLEDPYLEANDEQTLLEYLRNKLLEDHSVFNVV